jgi:hypothetical protein
MAAFTAELARFFWARCVPKKRSRRAAAYREFARDGMDASETAELWAYCARHHAPTYLSMSGILFHGSKADVMRLARANVAESYIFEGLVLGASAGYVSGFSQFADVNWRSVDEVITLSTAGVPYDYARSLRELDAVTIVAAYEAETPADYARAANRADMDPSTAWVSGVPREYLVTV